MMAKSIPARLLVVDQDTRYGEWLKHHLGVLLPESTVSVLNLSDYQRWSEELSGRDCDVLMLGASFGSSPEDPQAQGLELLRQLREKAHFPAVIAIAEEGNELTAVRAMQLGAVDYLPKRLLTPERLKTAVRLALRMIEKRVARRIANLSFTNDAQTLAGAKFKTRTVAETEQTPPGTASATSEPAAAEDVSNAEAKESAQDLSPADGKAAPESKSAAKADDGASENERPSASKRRSRSKVSAADNSSPEEQSSTPTPAARAPGGEFMSANFIPGYTIHATIGESEKAAVYVATSAALGENVALKVSKTLRDEAAGRQFLEREYTAIVAIHDPSVVQIYDYGVHAGYEYLVMEYLPRGDLKARMQQVLTEQEALRYVAQIAAALQVVHHAGLLHRDLKPPNVMLRESGDVALIDFGLARALDGSTPSTRTGVLRGSPYYMSPEQALGEVLDARSDFYSLGIIFYEMLTGKKPYTGGSAMDVLQQHVNSPVPMLPKALAHHEPILQKLMAKSREDRYGTAEEILEALGAGRPEAGVPDATQDSLQVESSAA
jgi:serine/threonine protein kinase/DNA-binding response OmpR family regulator